MESSEHSLNGSGTSYNTTSGVGGTNDSLTLFYKLMKRAVIGRFSYDLEIKKRANKTETTNERK